MLAVISFATRYGTVAPGMTPLFVGHGFSYSFFRSHQIAAHSWPTALCYKGLARGTHSPWKQSAAVTEPFEEATIVVSEERKQ